MLNQLTAVMSAVYELLLRQGQKFSCLCKVGTLESPDGGECPACAAMSLILDWYVKTLLNPVDKSGKVGIFGLVKDFKVLLMVLT